jgi:hypothetical protein
MAIVFPKFIRRPLNLSSTTATQLFRLRFPQTECLDTARKILFPKISNFFYSLSPAIAACPPTERTSLKILQPTFTKRQRAALLDNRLRCSLQLAFIVPFMSKRFPVKNIK